MAQFAPTYMTVYDNDDPGTPLVDLNLSANTMAANAAIDTVIGNITGVFGARSRVDLIGTNASKFSVDYSGGNFRLKVANAAIAAGAYPISIREQSQYTSGSPRVTNNTITAS